jgi:hypothetical protein
MQRPNFSQPPCYFPPPCRYRQSSEYTTTYDIPNTQYAIRQNEPNFSHLPYYSHTLVIPPKAPNPLQDTLHISRNTKIFKTNPICINRHKHLHSKDLREATGPPISDSATIKYIMAYSWIVISRRDKKKKTSSNIQLPDVFRRGEKLLHSKLFIGKRSSATLAQKISYSLILYYVLAR